MNQPSSPVPGQAADDAEPQQLQQSLQQQLSSLEAENQTLRARMALLLEQVERNHDIMCRHQAFDLEIVGASTFPELIGTIFRTLPEISDLDGVTLSLLDEEDDILLVMEKLGVDFSIFPQLLFVHEPAELGFAPPAPTLEGEPALPPLPLLGAFDTELHGKRFPGAGVPLCSVALVPLLRNKRLIGSLNLASSDVTRFTPALGTDFIKHMASIIAICLENVISNEMLKYIGLTDSLTGVYNRRYIDRRLLEEIARARRQNYFISCMYIDIDHFKLVNDTHGHQGGDEVLREVAARIRHELRRSDALGRFGGEEFVVLLIDADLDSATFVAERIRASIADTMFDLPGGTETWVSVSIGVASLDGEAILQPMETVAQQLVANADLALYQAKAKGRNQVVSWQAPIS
ncbi:diguanylate cyclase (GGDEF)-like protein [Janthinobacterium sp. K2Li3]|nr:diguanylate cyclase (GGDEF)-like protein [Janthinobacterium sp. K2C7]MBB5383599.1 diguanylate cyclase (GGDEF)-like protein [Janthinobacterium sp. K2Li3]MBB5389053.1 diguanylate cyclase (GGDEF)-like protein [Janthinobacterium sp. K2E3]